MEELIPKRNMRVKVEVSDWKDAIRKAGELLVDDGKISTDYIENMISSVMELGPYVVLSKGFALAHSAPSEAVYESALSLITLKEAVEFGSPNDPVKVVMCLACKDKQSHIETLQKVAMKLMSPGLIEKLAECQDIDGLSNLINK